MDESAELEDLSRSCRNFLLLIGDDRGLLGGDGFRLEGSAVRLGGFFLSCLEDLRRRIDMCLQLGGSRLILP